MSYKHILLLLICSVLPFMSSCDKMDCNNGLDGQWQMIEWKSSTGEFIGGKEMKLFYSFQLQMMMFQNLSVSSSYVLSSFENQHSSIRIYDPIKYKGNGHDEILPMSILSQYGVPSNGIMKIEKLSSDTLVLSSSEFGQLIFRKY